MTQTLETVRSQMMRCNRGMEHVFAPATIEEVLSLHKGDVVSIQYLATSPIYAALVDRGITPATETWSDGVRFVIAEVVTSRA